MTPIRPSTGDLDVAIVCLGLHDQTPALANVVSWLKLERTLAGRQPIRLAADEHDPATWLINGRRLRFSKGSTAFWPFFTALQGDVAYVSWTRQSAATVRNARLRVIDDLDAAGHGGLAEEVRKCQVHNDGRVEYLPNDAWPRIIVE